MTSTFLNTCFQNEHKKDRSAQDPLQSTNAQINGWNDDIPSMQGASTGTRATRAQVISACGVARVFQMLLDRA